MTAREDDGRSLLRTLLNTVLWSVLVVFLAVVAAAVLVPRLLGGTALTVLSGSMEPTYSPGDMIVVVPAGAEEIQLGDVISFHPYPDDPALVTHRVIAVQTDGTGELSLVTQGDANSSADEPIRGEQIAGKVLYDLPALGFLAEAMRGDSARTLAIWAGGALLILGLTGTALRWLRRAKAGT
ncbi:signal peptidase I [Sediminivirga luteola]|jgi:signal peptidase|uniref:Signal peptidase I n=1 Tax=Sediminivirga luteola TaxID=1774748 RepID=A0A8J2TXJ7_9MICO|nr:signal peptidase I [Sediminivirga luteola]MCI2266659.1 signal peptidase I [Sediminivirga luteola]GGA13012.1 hypothetical protein GCM10011333_14900 [Sediminivirga luteola]